MSVILSEHLPLLATAPNGIQKIRGLILELAVRGKLVPQDPNDEPAGELLVRIAEERARLNGTKTRKTNDQNPVANRAPLFELPNSWVWAGFGEIALHNAGKTLDRGRNSGQPRDYITTSNLYWGRFELGDLKQMLIGDDEMERCTARKNDLLICEGGEAGRAAVWPYDRVVCFQNHVHRARFFGGVNPYFGYYFFEWLNASGEILQYRKGVGISNMSGKALASIPFALPPLAEQHRIVAKIDEVMALCHRLECDQADAESAHAKLVETLLGTLTQSTDAADFAENWQRLTEHFDTLFTTIPSVNALKQTILQLGVSGQLTSSKAFESLKLGDLLIDASYGTSQKCDSIKVDGACPVLRIPNVVRETIDLTDLKFSVLEKKELDKLRLLDGDILVVRTNGSAELVGRCAVVKEVPENATFASYMIRLRFAPSRVNPEFAQRCLQNHRLQNRMIDFARTTAGQYNVSIGRLRELEMQIPPLAEQQRIVAKIDELMALCGRLESILAQSHDCQERLASALVESAVTAA